MIQLFAIAPADAHALTMVAILAFALGSLVTMFFVMAHNGKKNAKLNLPDLPEPEETPKKKPITPQAKESEPSSDWEKDSDWWK